MSCDISIIHKTGPCRHDDLETGVEDASELVFLFDIEILKRTGVLALQV